MERLEWRFRCDNMDHSIDIGAFSAFAWSNATRAFEIGFEDRLSSLQRLLEIFFSELDSLNSHKTAEQ